MPDLPDRARVKVFPCPNCGETINNLAEICPFCAAPIDPAAAMAAVAETSRVSAACSDASLLKITAGSLLTFFALMFVPFFGTIGGVAYFCLSFVLPFMAVRWWIKYGRIKTTDADFAPARRSALIASAVSLLALIAVFPVFLLLHLGPRAHP